MKKHFLSLIILCCLFFTGCNSASIGIIGGADGPTAVYVSENLKTSYDVDKFFKENYIDEMDLPILDLHIDKNFVSEGRRLTLNDSIENPVECLIYEYYYNCTTGDYEKVYEALAGESLINATKADEENLKNGIYYSEIRIDDIDLVDKEDLHHISGKNQHDMIDLLNSLEMEKFSIVEVECYIKHNEKSLSQAPQVGNGEITRYYLVGKKDNQYKICEVYWEGFIDKRL